MSSLARRGRRFTALPQRCPTSRPLPRAFPHQRVNNRAQHEGQKRAHLHTTPIPPTCIDTYRGQVKRNSSGNISWRDRYQSEYIEWHAGVWNRHGDQGGRGTVKSAEHEQPSLGRLAFASIPVSVLASRTMYGIRSLGVSGQAFLMKSPPPSLAISRQYSRVAKFLPPNIETLV